eukprot:g6235.t1
MGYLSKGKQRSVAGNVKKAHKPNEGDRLGEGHVKFDTFAEEFVDGADGNGEVANRLDRRTSMIQNFYRHESRIQEVSKSIQASLGGAHPKATYVLSDLFQKEMGEIITSLSALCVSLTLFYWPTGIKKYIGFTHYEDGKQFLDGMWYLAITVAAEVLAMVAFAVQISKVSSTHMTRVGLFFAMKHKRFYFLAMLCGVTWSVGLDLQHNGCDWCYEFKWLIPVLNRTAEMGSYYRFYGNCKPNVTVTRKARCLAMLDQPDIDQKAVCFRGPTLT